MKFKSVLFDVGNVIASDYWESLWLSRHVGLADRLRIPIEKAKSAGLQLWRKYAVIQANEDDYWKDASRLLNVTIDASLIKSVEVLTVKSNPYIPPLLSELRKAKIDIGIISNNTTFWYSKQILMSKISEFLSEEIVFLSSNYGVEKCGAEWDLFSYAADKIKPWQTLVIDDRIKNVKRAKALGFKGIIYDRGAPATPEDKYYKVSPFTPLSLNGNFVGGHR